jgi:hypothetical protein
MTPYEQILTYIGDDLKRPDKLPEIKRRIQRAITKYHRKDFFKKDLVIVPYIFTTGLSNVQVIDLSKLARCRALFTVRKWSQTDNNGLTIQDPTTLKVGTLQGSDFTEISADKFIDGYGFDKQDVLYRAGNSVHLNSRIPFDRVQLGYFTDPLIEPVENISSWIPTEYPNLIASEVIYRLKKTIGQEEESKDAKEDRDEEWNTLLINNILVKVH